MAKPKGSAKSGGRTKGVVNKTTANAREAIAAFVEGNVDRLNGWLDAIAEENPKAAFECFMDVVEYHVPKLNRTEMQTLDKNGQPTNPVQSLTPHQQEALDRWAAEKYNLGNKEPKE